MPFAREGVDLQASRVPLELREPLAHKEVVESPGTEGFLESMDDQESLDTLERMVTPVTQATQGREEQMESLDTQ